ncbi:malate dehydrogenase-like [Pararge aegeria]|uniref:Malate dehydrogenase, mitochondrial n=1 Tax=Pararge aegeria aegeria TaxID=348720 RepID=A0A8S4RIU5_9NEOP|nr:malate dehydrogenase-like [Pararge aegeria]CAH2237201.1 jg11174 [Pararge aegeria aegeria]
MFRANNLLRSIPINIISRNYQVCVVGGATEIGQTVSLLLRSVPLITKLVIHDNLKHTSGVVLDLSHVPINSTLQGFIGETTLERALRSSNLIIATGGILQSPGTSEQHWFKTNAGFIKTLAARVAKISPMPFVGIATEPINILVPMAAEVMRNNGEYDPRKLFGITCGDPLKVQALYAAENDLNPQACSVPVIGGHSDSTIVPLLSQAKPTCTMNEQSIQEFSSKIRSSQEDVVNAKKGWSPTLSVAYGILEFSRGILDALYSRPTQINAYVENNDFGTSYFSGLVFVDKSGAGEMQRYTNLSEFECQLLERSIDQLRRDVTLGKKVLELA